jgi:hypothetical protein
MKNLISHVKLYPLALIALLAAFGTPALAQHEMHDMSKMPGASKPKAKPKPRPKPATAKRRQPKQAQPKQTEANKADDAEASEPVPATTAPAETPAPQPPAMPADVHKHMPTPPATTATQPASASEKTEITNPTPAESPAPGTSQPTPAAPHKHDMSNMNTGGASNQPQPSSNDAMKGMKGMIHPNSGTHIMAEGHMHELMLMSDGMMGIRVGSTENNTMAMGQMGSGTSWQPSTTPMYMWSKVTDKWLIFLHGEAKLGVNAQGGPRGVTKFESQNWIMPMAFRRVGSGTLQLRGMFSLEAFTFSPGGSPQLFQTGETYKGQPLVDKQHPHDLFMELSATYTIPIGERATWFTYVGFPGEPSLGPTAFMHRASASENPTAPLSHHLQDSSHISFGVFSTGFTYRWFKLEGSLFNGREPDENRYNFEFNPWNSRAVRFSISPNKNWAMQWSYGLLKNPEALKSGDVRRMTASLSYNKRFARGNWATSLIWGRNDENHTNDVETLNGYVAESTLNFFDKNYVYTRLELVDKVDLLSHEEAQRLSIAADHHAIFRVGAYTFGAARDIWNTEKFSLALGGDLTLYSKPEVLDAVYGNNPISYKFFIRIRPVKMSMGKP